MHSGTNIKQKKQQGQLIINFHLLYMGTVMVVVAALTQRHMKGLQHKNSNMCNRAKAVIIQKSYTDLTVR